MKIQLPNGQQHILDDNISLEEKLKVVEELADTYFETIKLNWHSNSVKFFLDSLANYIVWHKDEEDKWCEDKEILSVKKMEKMVKFKKTSKTINFSDLSVAKKEKLFGEGRGNE